MSDHTADFSCIERVPGVPRYCAQLRVWHKAGDQYIIAKCSPPMEKRGAEMLARHWARDHRCEFREDE